MKTAVRLGAISPITGCPVWCGGPRKPGMWSGINSLHIPGYLISPLTGWPIYPCNLSTSKNRWNSAEKYYGFWTPYVYGLYLFVAGGFFKTIFPYESRIVLLLFSYCSPIVLLLFSYCSPIVLLLFSYCSPIVLLLFSYCSPIVLLSFSYCSPIVLLSFSYSRTENDRRTIGGWTKNNGRCIDYTSVLKRRDSETQKGNQQCGMERKTNKWGSAEQGGLISRTMNPKTEIIKNKWQGETGTFSCQWTEVSLVTCNNRIA